MPLLGRKKSKFCQNYTTLWQKKVNRMPFSSDFHGKITALMPMLFQKDVHSLKNTLLSCPYFVETFKSKTHFCHAHIWSNNCQFCRNYIILWIKKVNRMLFFFFWLFTEKTTLSCPYFVKKTSTFEKIHCSQVHILSKNIQSLKNTALMSVFQIFTKTPCCQAHIW